MGFAEAWERCSPWIEAALERASGTHDLEDVRACVGRGEATLWAGRNAAVVTERVDYPKFSTFHFWLGGGDLTEIRDVLIPRAEAHYAAQGCRYATITGRRGWARALGYAPIHYTCAKEL